MRGINLSPKTPLSQIALYKVPCQRKHQEKVMKGERVREKKKKKKFNFNHVKVLEAKSF